MDWFIYYNGLRLERVNQIIFHHLLLNKKSQPFPNKTSSYLDIFCIVFDGGGYMLAVGGWWWIYFGWWWLVVGGDIV